MGGSVGGAIQDVGNRIGGGVRSITGGISNFGGGVFGNTGGGEGANYWQQGPRPDRPEFKSLLGQPGKLQEGWQLQAKPDIIANKDVVNSLRQDALAKPGESAWEKMALQKQGLEEAGLKDKAAANQMQALANARSGMAMRGGISGGAMERLADTGQRNQMAALQDVGAAGAKSRADIGLQAEQARQQLRTQMPGLENTSLQTDIMNRQYQTETDKYNLENALKEKQAKDAADMQAYLAQMKDWAGAGQANAMAQANNRGKK